MPYQRSVVKEIARQGLRRYTRPKSAGGRRLTFAERRKIRANYMTGIVESGLRNLSYGDADSAGYRQERASLYPNPTNLSAAVRRFYNEADQLYAGDSPASLAGRVQRPAAQYLYRYGLHGAEGKRLLRRHVLGKAAPRGSAGLGPRRPSGRVTGPPGPPVASSARVTGSAAPLAGLPDPEISARRNLRFPDAMGEVPSSGVPPAPDAPLSARIKGLTGAGQLEIPSTRLMAPQVPLGQGQRFVQLPGAARPGRTGLIGSWRKGGRLYRYDPVRQKWVRPGSGRTPEQVARRREHLRDTGPRVLQGGMGYRGTKGIAYRATEGLARGSEKRSTKYTASGNISDHWVGNRGTYAIDLPAAGRAGDRIAGLLKRRFGIEGPVVGTYDRHVIRGRGGNRYSVQILWRVPDHYDHVHLGVRRIG